jgi:hypothetical protein
MSVIEVLGFCFHDRLAEDHHDVLPLHFVDHPLKARQMFGVELDFLSCCGAFQPKKPVMSKSTRNFRCCSLRRSNSGANSL